MATVFFNCGAFSHVLAVVTKPYHFTQVVGFVVFFTHLKNFYFFMTTPYIKEYKPEGRVV